MAKRYHNVMFVNIATAAATDTIDTLLRTPATIDEDPDHANVSDGTVIAECEEGSRVVQWSLEIEIGAADPVNAAFPVSFSVWKDSAFGAAADPNVNQAFLPSTTLERKTFKTNICQYERFLVTTEGDKRRFRLHLPRRLRTLKQGESYKIQVANEAAANDAIAWTLWGRIVTVS